MSLDLATIGVEFQTGGLERGQRALKDTEAAANRTADAADRVTSQVSAMDRVMAQASKASAFLAASFGFSEIVRQTDEYIKFTAQLKLATGSTEAFNRANADVQRIAKETQAGLAQTGVLYARIANATKDMGVSQQAVAKITETVGLALKVSGAGAAEAASAQLQLSQAFASGVLRGEEFNAVSEAAPKLLDILAASMGTTRGSLREMAKDGQLTSDVLTKAFSNDKTLADLREQGKQIQTISGAYQNFKDQLMLFIGQQSEAHGTAKLLAGGMSLLADNLNLVSAAATGLAAAKGAQTLLDMAIQGKAAATAALERSAAVQAERASDVAAAQAKLASATAQLEQLTATKAAIVTSREQLVAELELMNAFRARGLAMQQVAVVTTELAVLGRQQASVADQMTAATARQTAAQTALTVAQSAGTGAAALATRALGLLGGPIGAITTLLGVGATAWALWGNQTAASVKQAEQSIFDKAEAFRAELRAQIELLDRRNAAAQGGATTKDDRAKDTLGALQQSIDAIKAERTENEAQELGRRARLTQALTQYGRVLADVTEKEEKQARNAANSQATAEELTKIRMKQAGIDKDYLSTLATLKKALDDKAIGEKEYIQRVSELAAETYKKSAAGKAAAEAEKDSADAANAHNRELEDQQKLLNELAGINGDYLKSLGTLVAAYKGGKLSLDGYVKAVEALIAKQPSSIKLAKEHADAIKQVGDMEAEGLKLHEQYIEGLNRAAQSQIDRVNQLKLEAEADRVAAEQKISQARAIEIVTIARLEEQKVAQLAANDQAAVNAIQKEIDARRELLGLLANKEAREANKKAVEDMGRDVSQFVDDLNRGLTDSLFRAFESGKGFFKTLWDGIKNLFKTTVLKLLIQPVTGAITGLVTDALGLNSGSGASGLLNSASNLNSLYGAGSQFLFGSSAGASTASLVGANAVQLAGGDGLGALIAGNGGWAGVGVGSAIGAGALGSGLSGAFAAGSSAIGAGVGTGLGMTATTGTGLSLIGGTSGGLGLSAGAGATLGGSAAAGGAAAGGTAGIMSTLAAIPGWGWAAMAAVAALAIFGGDGGGPKVESAYGPGVAQVSGDPAAARGISDAIENSYAQVAQTLGLVQRSLEVSVYTNRDPEGDAATALQVQADLGGKSIYDRGARLGALDNVGRSDEELQAALVEETNRVILGALQASELAEKFKDYLKGATDIPAAVNTIIAVRQLDQAFERIGGPLASLTKLSVDAELAFVNQMGGLQDLGATLDSYFNNYYTAAEREAAMTRQMSAAFDELGVAMPATRDGMRALIDGALNDGNTGLAGRLLQLQQAFADLIPAADESAQATAAAAQTIADFSRQQADLEDQIFRLTHAGDVTALRERELAALDASLRPLQQRVYALEDERDAAQAAAQEAQSIQEQRAQIERQLLEMSGDTAAIRAAELAAIAPANRALQESMWARQDELTAAQDAARAVEALAQAQQRAAQERDGLERQILQLTGNTVELRARELAALDPGNAALQQRIYALQDEAAALDRLKGRGQQAYTILQASVAEQRKSIDAEHQAKVAILQAQRSSAQAMADGQTQALQAVAQGNAAIGNGLQELFGTLQQAIDALSEKIADPMQSLAEAQRVVADALATARAGGVLPTAASLQGALGVLTSGSTDPYATRVDFDFAQASAIAQLKELQALTGAQQSVEQQTLDAIQTQIAVVQGAAAVAASGVDEQLAQAQADYDAQVKQLDDLLTNAQKQLAAAMGQEQATLDLTGALNYFGATLTDLATANVIAIQDNQAEIARILEVAGISSAFGGVGGAASAAVEPLALAVTTAASSNDELLSELLAEIRAFRAENMANTSQTAVNTGKLERRSATWDADGMPTRPNDAGDSFPVYTKPGVELEVKNDAGAALPVV